MSYFAHATCHCWYWCSSRLALDATLSGHHRHRARLLDHRLPHMSSPRWRQYVHATDIIIMTIIIIIIIIVIIVSSILCNIVKSFGEPHGLIGLLLSVAVSSELDYTVDTVLVPRVLCLFSIQFLLVGLLILLTLEGWPGWVGLGGWWNACERLYPSQY